MRNFIFLLCLPFALGAGFTGFQQKEVIHELTMDHPAFGPDDSHDYDLVEVRNDQDRPTEYYMNVVSVLCVDHVCKIVPVKLFWTPLGEYSKYELSPGIELEKGEGEPFTEEDYQLLDTILRDENSPYGNISYYDITHEKVIGEGQVDAISGATEVVLKNGQTIIGAAWTCYTLWHWANGMVVSEIQNITGRSLSEATLRKHLDSEEIRERKFAIDQIIRIGYHQDETLNSMTRLFGSFELPLRGEIIAYFESLSSREYGKFIAQLTTSQDQVIRLQGLNSLLNVESKQTELIEQVVIKVFASGSYQEVGLAFNLINSLDTPSQQIRKVVIDLLDHDNFLMARRAYWYLSQGTISSELKEKLDKFKSLHIDKL